MIEAIQTRLVDSDDQALWREVLHYAIERFKAKHENAPCFIEAGLCSKWLRPHQLRWTAAGGFAWPVGYGNGTGAGSRGIPEFDWSVVFEYESATDSWQLAPKFHSKQRRVLRLAIPARSARHQQAAINAVWQPEYVTEFWGFRKKDSEWQNIAICEFKHENQR
jgi:hypothetical protein